MYVVLRVNEDTTGDAGLFTLFQGEPYLILFPFLIFLLLFFILVSEHIHYSLFALLKLLPHSYCLCKFFVYYFLDLKSTNYWFTLHVLKQKLDKPPKMLLEKAVKLFKLEFFCSLISQLFIKVLQICCLLERSSLAEL